MTTELRDTLAQILVQAIGDEYAKVIDPRLAARCWEDHGPALSVKVQSELSAAGYAVVPKAWLVGSGMTKDERLAKKAALAATKGEGDG